MILAPNLIGTAFNGCLHSLSDDWVCLRRSISWKVEKRAAWFTGWAASPSTRNLPLTQVQRGSCLTTFYGLNLCAVLYLGKHGVAGCSIVVHTWWEVDEALSLVMPWFQLEWCLEVVVKWATKFGSTRICLSPKVVHHHLHISESSFAKRLCLYRHQRHDLKGNNTTSNIVSDENFSIFVVWKALHKYRLESQGDLSSSSGKSFIDPLNR